MQRVDRGAVELQQRFSARADDEAPPARGGPLRGDRIGERIG